MFLLFARRGRLSAKGGQSLLDGIVPGDIHIGFSGQISKVLFYIDLSFESLPLGVSNFFLSFDNLDLGASDFFLGF